MKRPLLWAALLLTLGVLIINSRPESRDKWLLRKPSVRLALEKSSSGYFPVALKGTVLWAEEKEGRPVYRIDCGKKYGTVLVYGSEEAVHEEEPSELAGSTVRVSGTAFLFQPSENPGQFDVQAYYDDLGIYFGVSQAEVWLDAPKKASFRRFLCRLSAAYKTVIRETTEKEEGDFLLLLSQGDRSESGEEMKKEAAALSALQLISVSGFIISSIGMLFYRILRKRSTDLFLCAGIPFFLIFFYFLFLGAPVSMIRALILFLMRILAPLLKRRFDTLSAASLSVLLLGITRPTYLLLPSMPFYLAVLLSQGLVCPVVRKSLRKQSLMASLTLSFFSMQAALLPVQILSRNSFSPYGMLLVYFLLPVRTAVILFTLAGSFIGVVFGRNAYGIVRLLLYLPGKMRL
ncbi:MAG: ComEC/Rec2 family competence protein, partial [Lachnospiraceae bacterium]|nr:ComEC/Rec2 family competence protein [Lachnospiraceae bacterium]